MDGYQSRPPLAVGTIPSRPGSSYTLGMALMGVIAYLAVPGFIVGLVSQSWWLAGLSAYLFPEAS